MAESNMRNDISYTLGINMFSDWTDEEYSKLMGYKEGPKRLNPLYPPFDMNEDVPEYIDWRVYGALNTTKQ